MIHTYYNTLTTGQNIVIIACDKKTGNICGYFTTRVDNVTDEMEVKITKDVSKAHIYHTKVEEAKETRDTLNLKHSKVDVREVTWHLAQVNLSIDMMPI